MIEVTKRATEVPGALEPLKDAGNDSERRTAGENEPRDVSGVLYCNF